MTPWIIKYKPGKLSEVIGNETAKEFLKNHVVNFNKNSKPLFIHGPYGCGKTSSVQALAKDLDMELTELNNSDYRKASDLTQLLSEVVNQGSLFAKKKLILMDEIEGLSGVRDRGALAAVLKIAEKSTTPIIFIGVDAYDQKSKPIRKKTELLKYDSLQNEEVYNHLKKIAERENIIFEEQSLKQLARMSGGDLRSAINDFQLASTTKTLFKEDLEIISNRDTTQKIEDSLKIIFQTQDPITSLETTNNLEIDLDKIFLWIDENLSNNYTQPEDYQKAYQALSQADIFFGRIRRMQHYRFYVYSYALLTAGISLAKKNKYRNITIKQPSRLLKIWIANNSNAKRKDISQKLALKTHTSKYEAYQSIPYIKAGFKNEKFQKIISEELELNTEEKNWLLK